jgi:hypothetical protein
MLVYNGPPNVPYVPTSIITAWIASICTIATRTINYWWRHIMGTRFAIVTKSIEATVDGDNNHGSAINEVACNGLCSAAIGK